MRRWLALLLMLMLPVSQAASWDDAVGDQEIGRKVATGPGAPEAQWSPTDAAGWYQNADVVAASISETAEHLIFEVELQSIDDGSPPPGLPEFEEMRYVWKFTYQGEQLHAGFETWGSDFTIFGLGEERQTAYGTYTVYRAIWFAEERDDVPGYRAIIPKWMWRNSDHVPVRAGDTLEDLRFEASDSSFFRYDEVPCARTDPSLNTGIFGWDCGWRVRDLMQDGAVLGDFEVKLTPPGVGHLFLRMDDPIRQSNGLATTYIFEAKVHNLDDKPDTFFIQVADAPPTWEVHHPASVSFDGKGDQTVKLAVTVPFVHTHGDENIMRLSMISSRNASVAMSTHFGVVFADPPQPAGHHDTLYFHTEGWYAWMNTLVDDPEGTHQPVGPWSSSYGLDQVDLSWRFTLNPRLDIGLDFDRAQQALAKFAIQAPQDMTGRVDARLSLLHWETGAETLLAHGQTEELSFSSDAATEIALGLDLLAAAERVPPQIGTNLVFTVNLTGTPDIALFWFGDAGSFHTEEASLKLPLIDYHDEVDLTGLQLASFNVEAINGTSFGVNPGRTAVAAFNVTNLLGQRMTLDWEVRGTDRFLEWTVLATPTTHLKAGGTGTVIVRYSPPADATEADIAEFVLIGRAREDAERQVFSRLAFFVVTDEDIPDQADFAKGLQDDAERQNARNKESPLPAVLVLAALALAVSRRR